MCLALVLTFLAYLRCGRGDWCFWIKPPKLKPVQGWYEEDRLVAPEGGAPKRGPHPPRPPKFLMEGRIPSRSQREVEEDYEEPQPASILKLDEKQVGNELRYLSLAKMESKAVPSINNVRAMVETASEEAQCGALQAEDLSSTLRAIATFRNEMPQLKTHLGVISDTLLGRAMDLKATGTSDALWAVAEMSNEAPMLQGLLPVLVYRLAKTARELTTQETISNLFSVAILREKFRELKLNIAPLTAYLANSLQKVSFKDLSLQELVDLFYSLSFTRTLPDDLFKVLVASAVEELKERKELSKHNTYSLLYSIAMLQETCAHRKSLELLPNVLESLEVVAAEMMPEQIVGCLWALGWADPGAFISIGSLERIRDEIGTTLGELKMKDLSHALWAMAALDFRDEELLGIAADRFVEWHPRVKAPILAKHIARVTWAFAKLRFHHTMFKLAIEDRLRPEKFVIRFLEPDQLHALAWSFTILNKGIAGSGLSKTRNNINAKIKAYIKMKYRHGIGKKIDEYGDERLRKVTVGRIEPYVEIDPRIQPQYRNQEMLRKATSLGEAGPDVPNVRRKISGRPKWSVTRWVDEKKRFIYYAQQEQQKMLKAAAMKQLEAASTESDGDDAEAN